MSDYRIEAATKEEWAERALKAEARVAELEAAANQARLALAGYASAQSAINMLDATLGEKL